MHDKLMLLPNKPGCYLMKNKDNIILYVGKAKNLKIELIRILEVNILVKLLN